MTKPQKGNYLFFLLIIGIFAWLIPGAGYYMLNEKRRAAIIFVTIILIFCLGIYVGSIGVIDPIGARIWYSAQIATSPLVALLGRISAGSDYPVYGRAKDLGQIYTAVAGLLNLLSIINTLYLAHVKEPLKPGD